ncbi:UNVERIFIED_CONTAM: hypothetical protein GTU68_027720 [Idotea baltica]|nr:hypothetical protein [Idotea baltica]
MLQTYFTHKSISHYRNVLFFFSLFLDRLLPGLTNIIVMDIDIKVKGDIADLHSHFSRFSDTQVMGMSPELSPVYRNILTTYRSKHPDTTLGSPHSSGGFPGYNSGVLLINIPRMKKSPVINSYLSPATLKQKVDEYDFQGHLADQDLYTLIALDHPEIFYTLPCGWNRQLCQWWNNDPFKEVFPQYFKCDEDIKLLHGNCKAKIPDEDNT